MDLKADDLAGQRAEVARLESELIAAKARLYTTRGTTPSTLLLWSWLLWGYLLGAVICAVAWGAWLLVRWNADERLAQFSLACAAGIVGAALSGLISLNERVANGWEFDDGTREPDPAERKERFNRRLAGGFLARPFLGVVSGPLVLAGGRFGHFASAEDEYGIVFLSLLGGLFSKTLFDWLRDAFKKILGK